MNPKEALKIEIARRKRLEEALCQSEERLREVERLANIGHFERDIVKDRLIWSEETCRIFGRRPGKSKFHQADLERMIYPEDRQLQKKALRSVLDCHRRYDVKYRIVRPDGEIRFVHVRDEVVRDKAGRPVRMFGTVQDITEHKKAEELRKRYNRLTRRERQVMNLVCGGKINKEIAGQFGTAEITIKVQRRNAMRKMQARSLAELAQFAEILRKAAATYTLV